MQGFSSRPFVFFFRLLPALLLLLGLHAAVPAQTPPAAPKPAAPAPAAAASPAAPASTTPAAPPPVPVADIAVQAETTLLRVRQLTQRPAIDDLAASADDELAALTRGIAVASAEMRRTALQNAPTETLRNLEQAWREIEQRAAGLTRELTRSVLQLERDTTELDKLEAQWRATRTAATTENAPEPVLKRIEEVNTAVTKAQKRLNEHRTTLLALQGRAANASARAAQTRLVLNDAVERAAARLLYRDSPPLWSPAFWTSSIDSFSAEADANLASQLSALAVYVSANQVSVAMHALLFIALAAALMLARRKLRVLAEGDDCLRGAARIIDMPAAAALLLALLASHWFYPRPPLSLWTAISMLGTLPVLLLTRRLMEVPLRPTLYVLLGFYLADRLRAFAGPLPVLARVLFLAEGILFIGFTIWILRSVRPASDEDEVYRGRRLMRTVGWFAGALTAAAVAVNINGQVRLADLLGSTALFSAYMAAVLYALVRVGEGVAQGTLCLPLVSRLGLVRRNKPLVTGYLNRGLRLAAVAAWLWLVLQALGLFRPLVGMAQQAWKVTLPIGSFTPEVSDIVLFILILWAAFKLSRLTRFVLEEEVYPKLHLQRGLPYAVSRVMHYLVLVVGFVLALNALGVDMTKFTILAGAFTVGIGFGLQNIVNNFVSGLIVLFERPIKVGDTVQIDDVVGQVRHIGIRASVIASTTGAEVIIPNGKLIADKVTNWTLSGRLRQITVPVTTPAGIDVQRLRGQLLDIARSHDLVAEQPPPEALFVRRGLDAFDFELRVWTAALDQWQEMRSELIMAIDEALRQAASAPAAGGAE
ncbi:Small-conductance mechanosensitive channel [Noviherbaspirillum humi]|uniref:Small-conductance mechanosensitive channel n=1 Tax=Noviherbaspirillum humi TaxID=1688639 RepID=A0A239IZ33_9BURK|nr:mechanosensitive ion channel domain-containing protein [Noviherbaspirillum humi]SNS98880.1 Small-conductance mechanosensitive channel [Noviherbaspirillum humi]